MRSGWVYRPPLDAVIAGLKFRHLDYLGHRLGERLARRWTVEELGRPDLVVPIPLHWWRRLGRGYNQAALIARPVASALEVPVVPALRRRRATPPQSRLPRSGRLRNLEGAFVGVPSHCRGRTVLLIDDVFTTGATLTVASRALRRAGASSVTAMTVARVVEPGSG